MIYIHIYIYIYIVYHTIPYEPYNSMHPNGIKRELIAFEGDAYPPTSSIHDMI